MLRKSVSHIHITKQMMVRYKHSLYSHLYSELLNKLLVSIIYIIKRKRATFLQKKNTFVRCG